MEERTIAVLGAGTMGAGIAQLAAQNGFDVILYDVSDEFIKRGLDNISKKLQRRVDQGKMRTGDMSSLIERIRTTTNRDEATSAKLIIEAAPEDIALKREIFGALSEQTGPDTLLASNTSSLSITSIASSAKHPERVVGMHFFNPAPVMPLIEVISGARTSPECAQAVYDYARSLGKTPIRATDMPGFVVNRVARPFYGESLRILGEGTASVAQIDEVMRLAGFPMGPFELMDFIGIDVNFAVTKSVFEAFFYDSRYRPHPIQQRMVEAGTLGKKSGAGFYDYSTGTKGDVTYRQLANMMHSRRQPFIPPAITDDFVRKAGVELSTELSEQGEIIARVLSMIINEAAFAVGESVASVRDIDMAMRLGTNYPHGPLRWGDMIGLDLVYNVLNSLQESLGEERYKPAPFLHHLLKSGAVGDAVGAGFHSPGEKGMV